jgi:hypothetical protein
VRSVLNVCTILALAFLQKKRFTYSTELYVLIGVTSSDFGNLNRHVLTTPNVSLYEWLM